MAPLVSAAATPPVAGLFADGRSGMLDPMSEPPIMLCDVMETLVHEPYYQELPAFFEMTLEELAAAQHPTAWLEFEEGCIDEAAYLARFFRDGRVVDREALRAHMSGAYRWLDGMEGVLADLHAAGLTIHALSNYSVWYELIDEKLRLSRYLKWTFVSCRTGVRKPDPEAFLGPCRTLGLDPAACLFIDDQPANVAVARGLGMDAILFRDAPTLRRDLGELGILSRG
jgi:HAD superfamily hydrolase (TIGR01509 family)